MKYKTGETPEVGDVVRYIGQDYALPKDRDLVVISLTYDGVGFGTVLGYGWIPEIFDLIRRAESKPQPEIVSATRPKYYQIKVKGVECDVFDLEEALGLGMKLGTALKYMTRAGEKDPAKHIEDLKKAIECINREIAAIEAKVTK